MYCFNCGREIEETSFCPHCGTNLQNDNMYINQQQYTYQEPYVNNDKVSVLWCIASFLFPFVGVIAYFVFKGQKPIKAKACLQIALISIGINFLTLFLL